MSSAWWTDLALFADPWFYLLSIPAVLLYGISKGGFGGSVSVLSVPMMALVMSPTRAAAILLPILVVMDAVVVKTYWGILDRTALRYLLPGALVGIFVGYITVGAMDEHYMRVLIGTLALAFGAQQLLGWQSHAGRCHNRVAGSLLGALAGFTSFSIHAGGPPFTIYLQPKQLSPLLFAGTAGIFFAVVNAVKLVPYYSLGQLSLDNLAYSLALVPLAPVGVKLGHYLVRRSGSSVYYRVISFFLLVIGAKLLWDGLAGLLASP